MSPSFVRSSGPIRPAGRLLEELDRDAIGVAQVARAAALVRPPRDGYGARGSEGVVAERTHAREIPFQIVGNEAKVCVAGIGALHVDRTGRWRAVLQELEDDTVGQLEERALENCTGVA